MTPGSVGAGWLWIAGGLVLMLLELFMPGAFMLWLGIAAIVTGLAAFLLGMGLDTMLLVFSAAALASVGIGREVYRRASRAAPGEEVLNARSDALVGHVFMLEEAVSHGHGRIRVDDTLWRVEADRDIPAGTMVRVERAEGAVLRVVSA